MTNVTENTAKVNWMERIFAYYFILQFSAANIYVFYLEAQKHQYMVSGAGVLLSLIGNYFILKALPVRK